VELAKALEVIRGLVRRFGVEQVRELVDTLEG
jgi:hypothetical protein